MTGTTTIDEKAANDKGIKNALEISVEIVVLSLAFERGNGSKVQHNRFRFGFIAIQATIDCISGE